MVAYLDSSVLLQHILKGDEGIRQVMICDRIISSELLEIECKRVLHRYRLQGYLDDVKFIAAMNRLDNILEGVSLLLLSQRIKMRSAQSFPVIIKTLDALHLSSAIIFNEEFPDESLLLFTYDNQLNRCARVLDFTTPFS